MANCRRAGAATGTLRLPTVPPLAAQALSMAPLPAVRWPLRRVAGAFARRHPTVFGRLGLGPAGARLEPLARGLLREVSRLTGVALTRLEPQAW